MRGFIEINLSALRENALFFKSNAKDGEKIAFVVKADAYGHGVKRVVETIDDIADAYVVATVEEGLAVRSKSNKPALALCPLSDEEVPILIRNEISLSVASESDAVRVAAISEDMNKRAYVHLCLDTGMNRMGFKNKKALYKSINVLKNCRTTTIKGVYSHFFDGGNEKSSDVQSLLFRDTARSVGVDDVILHAAATDAFAFEKYRMDAVRIGIGLYGYGSLGVKPCLSVVAFVARVERVKKGESVGYGANYVASRDEYVATVSIGYGDGLPRRYVGGDFLVGGKRRKTIGVICMDYSFVLVDENTRVGDEAVVIGSQGDLTVTARDVARRVGTIEYEILCSLKRLPKVYSAEQNDAFKTPNNR